MKVLAIVYDTKGSTLGARIQKDDGLVIDVTTEQIKKGSPKFENAIVDRDGFVRAKKGSLPKIIASTRPTTPQYATIRETDKLLKNNTITLYHGNKDKCMIPRYGVGGSANDYGSGFYMTPDIELAKEWSGSNYSHGTEMYLHTYSVDISGLNILNLSKLDSMHWIAELLRYRRLNMSELTEAYEITISRILELYKLDTSGYDFIIGYRADDCYFSYAKAFVSGGIFRETLETALRNGNLGLQVCAKTARAFDRLKLVSVTDVPKVYVDKFLARDKAARQEYRRILAENKNARVKQTVRDFI